MSVNKYANLPDIDTSQDVYETEDVFPTSTAKDVSSDEEVASSRLGPKGKPGDPNQELDSGSFISPDEASKRFRKAERSRPRRKVEYVYPPSPTSLSPTTPPHIEREAKPTSYRDRLRLLQSELISLENELSDPTNPLLHKEREEENVDPGELIRELVDVRGKLEKVAKLRDGRGRLVEVILNEEERKKEREEKEKEETERKEKEDKASALKGETLDVRNVAEMDRRVGELEKLIGSSTTSLDEAHPLPQPLLPLLTRLNSQLTLLTQPRHLDAISRRLKLLLSDLDRTSASGQPTKNRSSSISHSHHKSEQQTTSGPISTAPIFEQLAPILTRLGPNLSHIPHILTRLRTLSSLHTSAAEFQSTLEGLEADQKKVRGALEELDKAVGTVEKSLEENRSLVKGNVQGLEERIDKLGRRLEDLEIRREIQAGQVQQALAQAQSKQQEKKVNDRAEEFTTLEGDGEREVGEPSLVVGASEDEADDEDEEGEE